MTFPAFAGGVKKILNSDLPSGRDIVNEGRGLARDVVIGRTAFFDRMGVASEIEYKRQCIRAGRVMFHAHIGLGSWGATADALRALYNHARDAGTVIDRAGICLDRRMGLPGPHRANIPAETGPTLDSPEDWLQVGQAAPIQPHMGDFMIGFPASTENTLLALKAGVTTIGNLSQYFAHEVPMWRDHTTTAVETLRAMALMGALRDKGTLVHSYLEDGLGAHFHDCATVAGWAYLERYIVEDLLGGKLAHCIGGLTTDPVKRAGWVFALHEIHDHDCIGSMFYGDTLSFTRDFAVNRGVIAEYLLWDLMAQLQCPTGHAVLPLPVTEAVRVPSAEEIAEVQVFGRQLETAARRMLPHVDFEPSRQFARSVTTAGKKVFENALSGFRQAGVDTGDPLQLLVVLKQTGPAVFESLFGAGPVDEMFVRGRRPVVPTDSFEMAQKILEEHRPVFSGDKAHRALRGRRLLIASTDVHEYAVNVINQLLGEAGAHMVNLGAEQNPGDIAAAAREHEVEAILISTHNGMALDYARCLKDELKKQALDIPVIMGGVLNQKIENSELPVDVSPQLRELGIGTFTGLESGLYNMLTP